MQIQIDRFLLVKSIRERLKRRTRDRLCVQENFYAISRAFSSEEFLSVPRNSKGDISNVFGQRDKDTQLQVQFVGNTL